ncbi:hypothetical protein OW493_02940 [Cobetia sp. 14N.309.X.WAT.E.A4]|uniref:hypothetical protein n=1 Tax=Cobetia sp. 14N.309.X.WAT.E.A4 TaxID=2998323 RepID=UPI0025B05250|nr:hypothetical protein [Cobetia sp. 14N.309.X.WAT.E.A4]MDN2655402.1 hypothetical protein [Cobetia sp. 14N.309.X.WAT.E.A4]
MSYLIRCSGEEISVDYIFNIDPSCISHYIFVLKDIVTNDVWKRNISPEQVSSCSSENIKGLESLLSEIDSRVKLLLKEEVGGYNVLDVGRVHWSCSSLFYSFEDKIINLDPDDHEFLTFKLNQESLGFASPSLSLHYTMRDESLKKGKRQLVKNVDFKDIGLSQETYIVLNQDELKLKFKYMSEVEAIERRRAFYKAITLLDVNHSLGLLHDVAKYKAAYKLSRFHGHSVTSIDEAYKVLTGSKVVLSLGEDECIDL